MPKVLENLVQTLKSQGKPDSSAWAIATSALQKRGVLAKGSQTLKRKKKKNA
jgi:hypothetical protein